MCSVFLSDFINLRYYFIASSYFLCSLRLSHPVPGREPCSLMLIVWLYVSTSINFLRKETDSHAPHMALQTLILLFIFSIFCFPWWFLLSTISCVEKSSSFKIRKTYNYQLMSDFNLIILCLENPKSMPCVLDLKKKNIFLSCWTSSTLLHKRTSRSPENNRIKIKVYFHANNLKIAGQLVHSTHFPGTIQRSSHIYPLSPNSLHFKNIPDNPFPPDCVGSERSVVPACLAVSLGSPVSSALCLTL